MDKRYDPIQVMDKNYNRRMLLMDTAYENALARLAAKESPTEVIQSLRLDYKELSLYYPIVPKL